MKVFRYLVLCSALFLSSIPLHAAQEATTPAPDRAALVDQFFGQSEITVNFEPGFNPDGDFAFHVADGVGLFVDFGVIPLDGTITLHPDSFIGGAVLASDPEAVDPEFVDAKRVSYVVTHETEYRELCAFDHRVGGPNVAGKLWVTLGDGQKVELGAEVGTSMIGFEPIAEAAGDGGRLVISWPNKYCRGVKMNAGSCLPKRCGMTLGDMIDLAGQDNLLIPTWILAAGVDKVAEWLGAKGYAVSGVCGEVEFLWFLPLGCQCVYVQF